MMSNKRILTNDTDSVEDDLMDAFSKIYPGLFLQKDLRIIMINRERKYRVGLLSGGGSGHEPFSAGFIGEGMLTAAVIGNVFASPPIGAIVAAIRAVALLNKGGVLILIMNYTGDVLNFSAAMEISRSNGYQVEGLIVCDDVSQFGRDVKGLAGKRGMVGVMLLAKILGGFSKEGKSLSEIVALGRCLNCRLGTLCVTLRACTLPGHEEAMYTVDSNTIEFGSGVHGEAGATTIEACSLKELVKQMLVKILSCVTFEAKSNVVIVVNNMGSMSQMELLIITREVELQLNEMEFTIERIYTGTFMTSIDMRGFQICLLNLTGELEYIKYLDEETEAFAWPGRRISRELPRFPPRLEKIELDNTVAVIPGIMLSEKYKDVFRKCLYLVAKSLMGECDHLNKLDREVGDGDTGTTFRHFGEGIIRELHHLPLSDVASTFAMLSKLAQTVMGGALGAIVSLLLIGAAKECDSWETCWLAAIEMAQKYSRARLGDRTLFDALIPACKAFMMNLKEKGDHYWPIALKIAAERAEEGCEATKSMIPRAGRASYVDPSRVTDVDPGAHAMVVILKALCLALVPDDLVDKCPI